MSSEQNATLAQRIEAKRRAKEIEAENKKDAIPESGIKPCSDIQPEITCISEALDRGDNPIAIARLLLIAMESCRVSGKELSALISKSEGWISKTIALLKAPADIQQQLEDKLITQSDYAKSLERRPRAIEGVGRIDYQRMPTVIIGIEAARSLAFILQILADNHATTPIKVDANTTKKDLSNILNLRSAEIRGLLK